MHPPAQTRRRLLLATLFPLAACGGDGSDPIPPEGGGQTVTVSVATSGQDLDTDGYTVTLGSRSEAVAVNGSASFDDVPPGTHTVTITGVAENCSVEGGASRSVSVTESSGAQVAFAVACDFSDGFATIACPDLSLGATHAAPLDVVTLGRLPTSLGDAPWGLVSAEGGESSVPAFVDGTDGETSGLLTPLHPRGSLEGGEVTIRITDGERACPPVTLTIDPLPAAPGALEAAVDELEALVLELAAVLGATAADLEAGDPAAVPPHLLPLAIVHSVLTQADPERSLRALIEELDVATAERVDALLGRVTLGIGAAESLRPSSRFAQAGEDLECQPDDVGTDPFELDRCMARVDELTALLPAQTEERLRWLESLEGVFLLTALAGGDATTVTVVLEIVRAFYELAWFRASGLLPTWGTLDVKTYSPEFMEDSDGIGHWLGAKFTARSNGFSLSLDPLSDLSEDARRVAGRAFLTLQGFPVSEFQSQYANVILTILVEGLAQGDGGVDLIGRTYDPVVVDDSRWTKSERIEGTSVELIDHQRYKAERATGTSVIRVVTKDDAFNGVGAFDDFQVEVLEIEILSLQGDDLWVEPGETIIADFWIANSVEPDALELVHPEVLQGEAVLQVDPTGPPAEVAWVLYTAPEEPDFDDLETVLLQHVGTSGARSTPPVRPLRMGSVWIRFAEVTISPRSACLDPGESFQFEVEVEGPDDESVTWSIADDGPGEIDANGLYTAPSSAPENPNVTIRAQSNVAPRIDDEVTIRIGDCSYYAVTVTGYQSYSGEGTATFLVHDGETTIWLHGNGDFGGNVYLDGARPDVGEHEVSSSLGSLRRPGTQAFGAWVGEGTVGIESSSAGLLEGTIQLTAIYGGIQGQDISILIEFKAPCDGFAPSCN